MATAYQPISDRLFNSGGWSGKFGKVFFFRPGGWLFSELNFQHFFNTSNIGYFICKHAGLCLYVFGACAGVQKEWMADSTFSRVIRGGGRLDFPLWCHWYKYWDYDFLHSTKSVGSTKITHFIIIGTFISIIDQRKYKYSKKWQTFNLHIWRHMT